MAGCLLSQCYHLFDRAVLQNVKESLFVAFSALPFNTRKLLWITYGICSLQALVTQLHHVERQIQACENSLREEKEKRRKYYVRIPSYALTACDNLLLKITLIKYLKKKTPYNESQSPSQLFFGHVTQRVFLVTDLTLAANDTTWMLVSWCISPVIQSLYMTSTVKLARDFDAYEQFPESFCSNYVQDWRQFLFGSYFM